ncbi:uncharacterized protein LOC123519816 isoform X2 [Portunus trituberculatus]|uniref:uncharacterized protein LOC123519816 isoform X2 n=1 Tax=Portunus trituberculatus TaxID=210409 RepID=UPI001E1CD15B|nr:uncharacterized protein LOC123519816 isoform X2 [Portunus trituberculatus]
MTRMKAIYDLVLSLHHTRKSSQQPSPRVALKRLSLETIKKYTGIRDVFESSCKSSPRKELSTSVESSLEYESEKEDYENFAVAVSEDEDSDNSSATKDSDITGQREDKDQDAPGSSSSDELPDLNNPSWSSKEVKKKEMKIQKRKKKNVLQKTDAKLMKSARRAFQHQANRYKASQEFMKTTKISKEVQHPELKLPYPDVHPPHNNTTIKRKEKSQNVKNAVELPTKSLVELMSLKLKESMIRYDKQERIPSVTEDVTGVEAQPTNTVEHENRDGEESDNSQDSNNSDCTVYFDSNEIEEIYTTSSQTVLEETSIDRENLVSSARELNYSKKRKDSPLLEKSEETSKKQKHDGQEKATEIDRNQQPMVMVPFSISSSASLPSAVPMSTTPSCLVTSLVQVPLKTFRSTIDSSNAPSRLSDSAELENKENIEKEDSDFPCKISSVSSVASEKNHGDIVTIHEKASHPSNVPQDKYIVIDNGSSQESGDGSGENVCAITPEPLEDSGLFIKVSNVTSLSSSADALITASTHKETNRDDSTDTAKEVVTDTSNKETDDQQEKTSSLSKEPVIGSKENAFKSLKELSLQFHELTTKRKECEKKIKEVKEEYNKKLEALEEEKKNYDVDIDKMVVALSEYKELTEEFDKKQEEPEKQQELAVSDANTTASECISELTATAPASIAVVQVPETNHVMVPPTDLNKKSSSERIHINVIPAANIRNFGKEKCHSVLKMQSKDPDQQTTAPYKPRKKSEKKTKDSSLRSFRHHPVHQEATISAPYQNLSVVEAAVNPPHFQKKQHQSISGDCSARSRQLAQDVLHYSAFDKQSPPNAVVVPGQQRPVVTSSHIICAAPPQPITHTAQRHDPVCQVKAMPNNNPGLVPSGHKNPVSSQVQQKTQFIPVHSFLQQQQPHLFKLLQKTTLQKQIQPNLQHHQHQQQAQLKLSNRTLVIKQHQQQQQQENNSQHLQNYIPVTGHLQNNVTQGQVIPATLSSPGSSNGVNFTTLQTASNFTPNTNVALKRMVVSDSPVEDSLICTGTNIQKTAYIPVVSSVSLNNLQAQSLNIVTDKRLIGAVSSSLASTVTTTTNASQQEAESQTDVSSHTEESEPICVMCKAPGIFMCCNNVIYCNTTCQGKDWSTHQHICTNTSSLDSS